MTAAATTDADALPPRFHLDVSPLQEAEYTGIPQVVAKLAEAVLGDPSVEPAFFYNRHEVPRWLVEALLRSREGSLMRWAAGRLVLGPAVARREPGRRVWGLHGNVKFSRRLFPVEGLVVHDLTTLVTPQHHRADIVAFHQTRFAGDLISSDVIAAVSHSTAADLRTFFPEAVARTPVTVAHLGVDWSHIPPEKREGGPEAGEVEPYVLVLGTLEPRKNVGVVLDHLQRDPRFARRFRVVFGGRVGWGDAFEAQLARRGLSELAADGRIVQTGFVSETVKHRLLRHARAVVYPSVYEGFGLPVAEAVSLGTPVVTTAAASLPEVGRGFAFYFDPSDPASFAGALERALAAGRVRQGRDGETLDAWRARFTWEGCWATVRDAFTRADAALRERAA